MLERKKGQKDTYFIDFQVILKKNDSQVSLLFFTYFYFKYQYCLGEKHYQIDGTPKGCKLYLVFSFNAAVK